MKKRIAWLVVSCLVVTALLMASCGTAVTKEEGEEAVVEEDVATEEEEAATREAEKMAPPTPAPDTALPSAITGLGASDAHDGRVNLWWDKSTAEGFAHYNV